MQLSLVCAMLLLVSTLSAQLIPRAIQPLAELTRDPRVQKALSVIAAQAPRTTEQQIRITEVPAPPFHESARGVFMAKLLAAAGLTVQTDSVGNVIGELAGSDKNDIVLIAAHLDTVFPADTDVHVRRENGRLLAPGISDNGTGLASLLALAQAIHDAGINTRSTILFAADVGEEGEGNLRGIRKLVETYRNQLTAVIAIDGSSTDYVANSALASRRVEITLNGPGGHSWSDFGAPNTIHAMARGIARFVSLPVPERPRTSFNVGEIEGGTSVNSIPAKASIKVDLRSESEPELAKLQTSLRDSIQIGVAEEVDAARRRGVPVVGKGITVETNVLGIRPSGELASNSPLLAAVMAADDYLGNISRLERSSTDANIPLSLGIPAIAVGAGGRSGGAHALSEWYDPAGREMGLRRLLLTLLQVARVTDGKPSPGTKAE